MHGCGAAASKGPKPLALSTDRGDLERRQGIACANHGPVKDREHIADCIAGACTDDRLSVDGATGHRDSDRGPVACSADQWDGSTSRQASTCSSPRQRSDACSTSAALLGPVVAAVTGEGEGDRTDIARLDVLREVRHLRDASVDLLGISRSISDRRGPEPTDKGTAGGSLGRCLQDDVPSVGLAEVHRAWDRVALPCDDGSLKAQRAAVVNDILSIALALDASISEAQNLSEACCAGRDGAGRCTGGNVKPVVQRCEICAGSHDKTPGDALGFLRFQHLPWCRTLADVQIEPQHVMRGAGGSDQRVFDILRTAAKLTSYGTEDHA